jgi:hypothetical protein
VAMISLQNRFLIQPPEKEIKVQIALQIMAFYGIFIAKMPPFRSKYAFDCE